jgi:hypothetical protein
LCSIIAFIDSSKECNKAWFLSFARRNPGDDIEENSCSNLELAFTPRFSKYAATLLIIASNAGYMASSLPLLLVMRLYIDYPSISVHYTKNQRGT